MEKLLEYNLKNLEKKKRNPFPRSPKIRELPARMELRQRRKQMEAAPPGKGGDTEDISKGKKGEFEEMEHGGWKNVGFITAFVVILLVRSLFERAKESIRNMY